MKSFALGNSASGFVAMFRSCADIGIVCNEPATIDINAL
jgi:hypothetical protein